jgi:tetratricopeptide (TPR) repeat protein
VVQLGEVTHIHVIMDMEGVRKVKLSKLKEKLPNLAHYMQYNPTHFLREQPVDEEELKAVLEEANTYLRQVLQEPKLDPQVLIYLYSYLGNGYRVLYQTSKAVQYLEKALELTKKEEDLKGELRALIRLGEAFKYDERHEAALACFGQALAISSYKDLEHYRDYALQHMGKCLLELGEYENALLRFDEALELRKKKGNQSLVLATETAIVLTHIMKQDEENTPSL